MKHRSGLAVLALLGLLAAPAFSADAPSAASSASPTPTPSAQPRPRAERHERLLEQLRERGLPVPSGLPSVLAPVPVPPPAPPLASGSSSAAPVHPSPLADELGRKWRAFTATRSERRDKRHAALVRELGSQLSNPEVQAELRLHATRQAELNRVRFLADNARTGAEREKLLARVDKLSERERQRHERRMAKLGRGAQAAAAASASAAPAPAASARVPRARSSGATP